MSQGGLASNQGGRLEDLVKAVLMKHGFKSLPYSEYIKNPEKYGKELLLTNKPYRSIYGHNGKTEFFLISKKYNLEILIECKWQQSNGSVDEKLPYLYLNCIEALPEKQIIIVIDGDGWKKGAIQWLRDAVIEQKYFKLPANSKIINVFDLKEFMT